MNYPPLHDRNQGDLSKTQNEVKNKSPCYASSPSVCLFDSIYGFMKKGNFFSCLASNVFFHLLWYNYSLFSWIHNCAVPHHRRLNNTKVICISKHVVHVVLLHIYLRKHFSQLHKLNFQYSGLAIINKRKKNLCLSPLPGMLIFASMFIYLYKFI